MKRLAAAASALLLCSAASGYYHFLHYRTVDGQLVAIPEKFNLSALPNNTVQYFISLQGPEALADGDSLQSVVSEIQAAASVWNTVETSKLRLQFGGFRDPDANQNTPSIDVSFEEMAPGIIALGGPTVRTDVVTGEDGDFVPIARAVVKLNKDLSDRPSYTEKFFLTMVHEIGHTLGLQHSLSSSVMSTEVTRSTTKADPLDTDDEVAVSLLYPKADFTRRLATISGRVTMNGEGVHMASVVAIGNVRPPVNTLTLPDGSFTLKGLPAGYYYIYVHPLPPPLTGEVSPANMVYPIDENGDSIAPSGNFAFQFYGSRTTTVKLDEGENLSDVNFDVESRSTVPVHSVQTFSFYSSVAIHPGFFNRTLGYGFLLAAGQGLLNNGVMTDGLSLSVLNGGESILDYTVGPYPQATSYLQAWIAMNPLGWNGARHLVFSTPTDTYVLPNAFRLVSRTPPQIDSITEVPDGSGVPTAVIAGSNLDASTRILFDGQAAHILEVGDGQLTVRIPPAVSQHVARVVALNPDGQSSLFLQGTAAPTFQYGDRETPVLSMSPSTLKAGTEQLVEITGTGTDFVDGDVRIGFGNSDITVEKAWVTASNTVMANVFVSSAAVPGTYPLTVLSGINLVSEPSLLTIEDYDETAPVLSTNMVNTETGQTALYAGAHVKIGTRNVVLGESSTFTVTIGGLDAVVEAVEDGSITVQLPANLSEGPAVLAATLDGRELPPLAVQISRKPPVISLVRQVQNILVDAEHPALKDGTIVVLASNLITVEDGAEWPVLDASRFAVTLGNDSENVAEVVAVADQPGVYALTVRLSSFVPTGDEIPLVLWFDGQPSVPVKIPVAERAASE